jgi:hypothetical protein
MEGRNTFPAAAFPSIMGLSKPVNLSGRKEGRKENVWKENLWKEGREGRKEGREGRKRRKEEKRGRERRKRRKMGIERRVEETKEG